MFLLEWTASDLLLIALAGITMSGLVIWLVPGASVPRKRSYTMEEISAYDHQIPRYFLAAALSLMIGGLHTIIKSLPGFWQWLWQAGYGGHLFRDLSNSHIIIVGGGTVLLTGLTWYVLPRFTNRPLFSAPLAGASFWFTIIGVFGFYLSWLVLGLVEGNMVSHGMDYMAAKELVGAWHRVPTRLTSSIMGVGYWTYVLNVFLTVWAGRHVTNKPFGYLTKFVVVSAGALFVGTVQGVLQVLPANADWIHFAGKFGEYVDPISHAHVNLVTGMVVALAGFLAYFGTRMGGKPLGRRSANLVFWSLVPGSIYFYLTFLLLGLVLGGMAVGYGGIQIPSLAPLLANNMRLLLALAGSAMLIAFWIYFIALWSSLNIGSLRSAVRSGTPAGFWLVSSLALVVGTLQGLLQAIPATMPWFTTAEEIPNIHAQLNMIGGVLLALIGLVYLILPELVGQEVDARLRRFSLWSIASGIGGYYLATLTTGMVRYSWMRQGMNDVQAAAHLGWVGPVALTLTAIPAFAGFTAFGLAVFRATRAYRQEMASEYRALPGRFSGPMPERLKRIPRGYVLGMEFMGGLFGWPGLGWLYAGQALPGLALLMGGPAIAWALLPMLFSPYTNTVFSAFGWKVLLVWLPGSALLSVAFLGAYLHRRRQRDPQARREKQSLRIGDLSGRRRVPRPLLAGTLVFGLALFSIPIIPLLGGVPDEVTGQSMMSALPDRADGAYLQASQGDQSGLIKLYPWSFPLEETPDGTPAINPSQLDEMIIAQKGLDAPGQYHLFHVEDGDQIPLDARELTFQKTLSLRPREPLEDGVYMLDIPSGGMFAGRRYYYFEIDSSVVALPALVPSSGSNLPVSVKEAAPPAGEGLMARYWPEIFPVASFVISLGMAVTMLLRLRQKIRPHELIWALAFAMFAVASLSQVIGDLAGWTATLARIYYVFGATLVVGWLGLGTWYIQVRSPQLRALGVYVLLLISGYALGLISLAPVDTSALASQGWHALTKPLALTILTISTNSIGTLVLVGGALHSAWTFWRKGIQRHRMYGLLLLAGGALTVAAGGSLTRLGKEQFLYLAMSAGVALMYWGYRMTIRTTVNAGPQPVETRPELVVQTGAANLKA